MLEYSHRGEVSEWFKEHAWKACMWGNSHRGFESLSLRQTKSRPLWSVFGLANGRVFEPDRVRHAGGMSQGNLHLVTCCQSGSSGVAERDRIPLSAKKIVAPKCSCFLLLVLI